MTDTYKKLLLSLNGRFLVDPCSGGIHGQAAGRGLVERVEHRKIVDDAWQAQRRNLHTGTAELFVSQQNLLSDMPLSSEYAAGALLTVPRLRSK